MSKASALEYIKNSWYYNSMKIGGIPVYDYVEDNYEPWTLDLTMDFTKIPCPIEYKPNSGEYYGIYSSIIYYPNEDFSINGTKTDKVFELINLIGATGYCLQIYKEIQ